MSIKNRLKLSAAVVATFIGLLILTFWLSSREIVVREKKYAALEGIVFCFADLNVLMHEYVLFREPRMQRQWFGKYKVTSQQLEQLTEVGTLSSPLVRWIEEDFRAMGSLFQELEGSKRRLSYKVGDPLERRLITQLLVRSEMIKTHLRELLEDAHSGLYAAQKHGITVVSSLTLGLVVLGFVVICIFLMVVNHVNRLIRELIRGTQWVAAGELDYRLPEAPNSELGEVARSFNAMAKALKKTLVSRDQLSAEIEERTRAEDALKQSEGRFRLLFSHNPSPMWLVDLHTYRFLEVNDAAVRKYGYSREEFLKMDLTQIRPSDDTPRLVEMLMKMEETGGPVEERNGRHRLKDGSIIEVEVALDVFDFREHRACLSVIHDVTERRSAERSLKESEERFRRLSDSAFEAVIVHKDGRAIEVNQAFYLMFGYESVEAIAGQPVMNFVAPSFREMVKEKIHLGDERPYEMEMVRRDGSCMAIQVRARMIPYEGGIARVATLNNITEWKRAETLLREREARLRLLLEQMPAVVWSTNLNLIFTSASGAALKAVGLDSCQIVGRPLREFVEGASDVPLKAHGRALVGESSAYELTWRGRSFEVHVEPFRGVAGEIAGTIGVALDVTDRKESESRLKAAAYDLARSNKELEQFAYVASHDLQEPLRMVASFVDLLGRKYHSQLDENAQEFIGYAVDGAKRMKQLIDDLLTYSRVGRVGRDCQGVSFLDVLDRVQANLRLSIDESRAKIVCHPMPDLKMDMGQLTQLVQNLVSNALKFRSKNSPRVELGCQRQGNEVVFFVRDNGIGVEMGHAERIFLIFQRLHTSGEYPGTGIGLAICKKIVERHGGRIWMVSEPGSGSTFYFTLPEALILEPEGRLAPSA